MFLWLSCPGFPRKAKSGSLQRAGSQVAQLRRQQALMLPSPATLTLYEPEHCPPTAGDSTEASARQANAPLLISGVCGRGAADCTASLAARRRSGLNLMGCWVSVDCRSEESLQGAPRGLQTRPATALSGRQSQILLPQATFRPAAPRSRRSGFSAVDLTRNSRNSTHPPVEGPVLPQFLRCA